MRSPDPRRVLSPLRVNNINKDAPNDNTNHTGIRSHSNPNKHMETDTTNKSRIRLNSDIKENNTIHFRGSSEKASGSVKENIKRLNIDSKLGIKDNVTNFRGSPENIKMLKEPTRKPKSEDKSNRRKTKVQHFSISDEAYTPKGSGCDDLDVRHTPIISKDTPTQNSTASIRFRHTTIKSSSGKTRLSPDVKTANEGGKQGTPVVKKINFEATKRASKKVWRKASESVKEFMSPINPGITYDNSSQLQIESSVTKEPYNPRYQGPSDLHNCCYNCEQWEDIVTLMQEDTYNHDRLLSDKDGRNFLHILGSNESLHKANLDDVADEIVTFLLRQDATLKLVMEDNNGNFPFQEIFANWTVKESDPDDEASCDSAGVGDIESGTNNKSSNKERKYAPLKERYWHAELPTEIAYALYLSSAIIDKLEKEASSQEERNSGTPLSTSVENFKTSSRLSYERRISRQNSSNSMTSCVQEIIEEYIEQFASIEDIMKNFLYLHEEDRRFVFNFSIVRKAMMDPASLGPWLIDLFNDGKPSQERASEYISLLSETVTSYKETAFDKGKHLSTEKKIYKKFESLDKLMPSMLMLDLEKIEDLSSLPLISKGMYM